MTENQQFWMKIARLTTGIASFTISILFTLKLIYLPGNTGYGFGDRLISVLLILLGAVIALIIFCATTHGIRYCLQQKTPTEKQRLRARLHAIVLSRMASGMLVAMTVRMIFAAIGLPIPGLKPLQIILTIVGCLSVVIALIALLCSRILTREESRAPVSPSRTSAIRYDNTPW